MPPLPTPFHARTNVLNQSQEWRLWSGYLGAGMFEMHHEREYFAIRDSAALIDVSPLFKYEFNGADAERAVNRIVTRDVRQCAIGQVMYTAWCDDRGQLIDDGTVQRFGEHRFRLTAADPSLRWFQDCCYGMQVAIRDVSSELAALAVQGPTSREILQRLIPEVRTLGYFRLVETRLKDIPLTISRTGYTGDLGYELWVTPEHALRLWDCVVEAGAGYGIMPAGLAALDIARIEAGLVLIEVDYISAPRTFIPNQRSTPYEAGLGWTVKLTPSNDFVGRPALERLAEMPPSWKLAGLEIDWPSLEEIYGQRGLSPQVAGRANRSSAPIYAGHRQVGYASSHTFSPVLKKYIALATLEARSAAPGTELDIEFTVEHSRQRGRARVVELPFYNPPQKRG